MCACRGLEGWQWWVGCSRSADVQERGERPVYCETRHKYPQKFSEVSAVAASEYRELAAVRRGRAAHGRRRRWEGRGEERLGWGG